MKLDAEDWTLFDSKLEKHRDWFDKKIDVVHGRITDHEKEYPHHKLLNGNGRNGNGVQSYPTVQPDTFRSNSMTMLKLWTLILGVILGTFGILTAFQKLMGG